MSQRNGEKARANITRKRRTAQRLKDTTARAAAKQAATEKKSATEKSSSR